MCAPKFMGHPNAKSLILCPLLFWHWGDLLGMCLCADLSSPTWTHQTSPRFGSQFQGLALDEVGHLIFMSKTILELHFGNWLGMHGSSGTKFLDFVGSLPLKLPVIALALCWRFSSIFCISAACLLCPQNISGPLFVMFFYFLGGSYIFIFHNGWLEYGLILQTLWPHWGVFTVGAKARCSIEVVSGGFGFFL